MYRRRFQNTTFSISTSRTTYRLQNDIKHPTVSPIFYPCVYQCRGAVCIQSRSCYFFWPRSLRGYPRRICPCLRTRNFFEQFVQLHYRQVLVYYCKLCCASNSTGNSFFGIMATVLFIVVASCEQPLLAGRRSSRLKICSLY